MSKNFFSFMLCVWTALGIISSAAAASVSQDWHLDFWPLLIFALAVLGVSMLGVWVALANDDPVLSLVGYAMIAIPLGLLLGPVVALYTPGSVMKILFLTTCMVAVLGLVGVFIPDSLDSWGAWLFGGLLILIGGQFIIPIAGLFGVPIQGALTLWDWVGVVLFGGYVIFDFNRAMRVPYTMNNAIDCSVAIYLDFINIFIRLLRLLGEKK